MEYKTTTLLRNGLIITLGLLHMLRSTHTAPTDGAIRLTRSDGLSNLDMGNVEIYHDGRWGTVCDDGWVLNNAHVACRMLGFKRALGHTKQSYFGKAIKEFWLDDVQCYGTESTLDECEHAKWGKHNCDKREAAGIYCQPKVQEVNRQEISTFEFTRPSTTDQSTSPVRTTPARNRENTPNRNRVTQTSTSNSSRVTRPQTNQPSTTTTQQPTPRRTLRPNTTPRNNNNNNRQQRPNPRPTTRGQALRRRTNRQRENEIQSDDGNVVDNEVEKTTKRVVKPTKPPHRAPTTRNGPTRKKANKAHKKVIKKNDASQQNRITKKPVVQEKVYHSGNVPHYDIRVRGGRNFQEGRVEIRIDGGKWGVLCSDNWTLKEAMVACRHAGLNYAQAAIPINYFGGEDMNKLVSGVKCEGHEKRLYRCFHEHIGHNQVGCPAKNQVAGVICTDLLPDLVPNATLLMKSAYLMDRQMYYLQCAMEEGCASSSAYVIQRNSLDWTRNTRRLLRFSSSTWNLGTADFRPFITKEDWEWHSCHMHYHSMEVFAHYDVLDKQGNRIAEGHKASFCLEDVQCLPGHTRKYRCQGFGDQGISVGCADDYLHDIDCQWIDMTDVEPGEYIFRVHINPEWKVAELSYDNNAVVCDLIYPGYTATITNCKLGDGTL